MSPELLETLHKWLASDDPVERAHARWRLDQPNALPESESDTDRAARLITENPPDSDRFAGNPCGGCPG